ncbi:hypothetical protein [Longimicrobium sp.]|uniref:hypothetical protein n=1 Tax=Longimicrobium sp. TaxID=2029185 RepID=UPI002C89B464|nr:hypothetical protein [Longimicrobium sp.]HSU17498.1 hypothetical protein [Longimicrobium sp.]
MEVDNLDQRSIGINVERQVFELYQARSATRRFSCAEVEPVPPQWEQESALSFRGTDAEVDELLRHLEERRVLLLTAERGAGKVKTALYLGWHLRQRGRCMEATLLAESLDRKVRIDVRHLATRDHGFRNRLVIFPNAFSRADPDVTRLFETTDRSGWQQLGEQLRARGAYVVFTTDPGGAGRVEELQAAQGVHRRLSPHPPDLLADELERKLDTLAGTDGVDAEQLAALREGREWLLATFRYAPQVLEFVDQYLELATPGFGLEEAWRRMQNADGRILQDLDGDFEGWSFAFTLALAQCGGEAGGVPWVDVDRLHRHVRQWLRRDLNLRYADAQGAGVDADADADTRLEFSDTRLLKRAHAEVEAGALSHTVRFRDGAPPEGMWKAMLDRHRRALLTVTPGLRTLAERGDEELQTLRVLAARVLGRIGEMDAARITLPLMDRWAHSGSQQRRAALGALMDGVLASRAERYRDACLRHLRALQRAASSDEEPDAHLPAVIAAWSWVGDHDLSLAMRELGAIARERLVPMIEDTQCIERLLGKVERATGQKPSARGAAVLRSCRAVLRGVASHIYAGQDRAFLGVQFSVASLCATRGPVPVFTELRRWIADGGWQAGVVVALMFLHERGIADQLKEPPVDTAPVEGGPGASCNPLVASLVEGEAEVRQTARFLGEMYESLRTPFAASPHLQRYCLESLQAHLVDWVRDALPVPEHADAMRGLFESLASTHDGVLRDPLLSLLAGPEFTGDDRGMRAFAASVRV